MVKTTVEVDADLWRRFSLLILCERGERKKNEVIAELIKGYVERKGFAESTKQLEYILRIEEEREAFCKIKDELVRDPKYNGKYVAVLRGAIVGCDEDKGKLAQSVYERHGYIPIYIDRVAPTERHVEIPSPEMHGCEV